MTEQEARSLILYILDADRRGAPAQDILAAVERRLAALVGNDTPEEIASRAFPAATAVRDALAAMIRAYGEAQAQAQRERDARIAHNRAAEWDRLQESDTTGMAKPRYLEACDIAALIRDPSLD